jgi:hypothetical protein
MNPEPQAATDTDMTAAPPARPPTATAKRIAYGLLLLGLTFAVVVLCAMAANAASATGGCGGG